LHRAYVGAGLPPGRFWKISLRLCLAEIFGARERLEREKQDRIELAWMTANLTRADKLPSLKSLLNSKPVAERQSPVVLQAMFDTLAAAWA